MEGKISASFSLLESSQIVSLAPPAVTKITRFMIASESGLSYFPYWRVVSCREGPKAHVSDIASRVAVFMLPLSVNSIDAIIESF